MEVEDEYEERKEGKTEEENQGDETQSSAGSIKETPFAKFIKDNSMIDVTQEVNEEDDDDESKKSEVKNEVEVESKASDESEQFDESVIASLPAGSVVWAPWAKFFWPARTAYPQENYDMRSKRKSENQICIKYFGKKGGFGFALPEKIKVFNPENIIKKYSDDKNCKGKPDFTFSIDQASKWFNGERPKDFDEVRLNTIQEEVEEDDEEEEEEEKEKEKNEEGKKEGEVKEKKKRVKKEETEEEKKERLEKRRKKKERKDVSKKIKEIMAEKQVSLDEIKTLVETALKKNFDHLVDFIKIIYQGGEIKDDIAFAAEIKKKKKPKVKDESASNSKSPSVSKSFTKSTAFKSSATKTTNKTTKTIAAIPTPKKGGKLKEEEDEKMKKERKEKEDMAKKTYKFQLEKDRKEIDKDVKKQKEKIFPMEDFQVLKYSEKIIPAEKPLPKPLHEVKKEFKNLSPNSVGDLLHIYDTLYQLSDMFHLGKFSINQLRNALEYNEHCILIKDIHCALLNPLLTSIDEGYFVDGDGYDRRREDINEDLLGVSILNNMNWVDAIYLTLNSCDDHFLPSNKTLLLKTLDELQVDSDIYPSLSFDQKLLILKTLCNAVCESEQVSTYIHERYNSRVTLAKNKQEEDRIEEKKIKEQKAKQLADKNQLKDEITKIKEESLASGGEIILIVDDNDTEDENVDPEQIARQLKWNEMAKEKKSEAINAINKAVKESNLVDLRASIENGRQYLEYGRGSKKIICPELSIALIELKKLEIDDARRKDDQAHIARKKKREEIYEKELAKIPIRTQALGKDREFNRYYLFSFDKTLYVEMVTMPEKFIIPSDTEKSVEELCLEKLRLQSSLPTSWACLESEEEVDKLLKSLEEKGIREYSLKKKIYSVHSILEEAWRRRNRNKEKESNNMEVELHSEISSNEEGDREKISFLQYKTKNDAKESSLLGIKALVQDVIDIESEFKDQLKNCPNYFPNAKERSCKRNDFLDTLKNITTTKDLKESIKVLEYFLKMSFKSGEKVKSKEEDKEFHVLWETQKNCNDWYYALDDAKSVGQVSLLFDKLIHICKKKQENFVPAKPPSKGRKEPIDKPKKKKPSITSEEELSEDEIDEEEVIVKKTSKKRKIAVVEKKVKARVVSDEEEDTESEEPKPKKGKKGMQKILESGSSTEEEEEDDHDNICFMCNKGGNLLCCDTCTSAIHLECAGIRKAPRGTYECIKCISKKDTGGSKKRKREEENRRETRGRGARGAENKKKDTRSSLRTRTNQKSYKDIADDTETEEEEDGEEEETEVEDND